MIEITDKFYKKVAFSNTDGCWMWQGAKNSDGYGHFALHGKYPKAHRYAWEWFVGDIPQGLEIDHLCRNRACVNPWHLEAVSHKENVLRGEGLAAKEAKQDKCSHGHLFDFVNTYMSTKGKRRCRTCRDAYMKTYWASR